MSTEDTRGPTAWEQIEPIADKREAPVAPEGGAGTSRVSPSTEASSAAAGSVAAEPAKSGTAPARDRPEHLGTLVVAWPEPAVRTALVTYFPMLIAILSLGISIFQGYLFHRSIELSQRSLDLLERNVARGEYIRTCREVIETYFQVKQKVSALMPAADRGNVAGASRVTEAHRVEAQAAVARFGGLGTYLANFQDPGTRARYTDLTRTLSGIVEHARSAPLVDIDKLFAPADELFATMNDDCVRLARTMRL